LRKILKSKVLIIDEIGYTPIEKREANLFFNLISELYEKQSIILTSNKSFSGWAEMMGDEIMTTAMLGRLLHHAGRFQPVSYLPGGHATVLRGGIFSPIYVLFFSFFDMVFRRPRPPRRSVLFPGSRID
jgi:hypothetical protein